MARYSRFLDVVFYCIETFELSTISSSPTVPSVFVIVPNVMGALVVLIIIPAAIRCVHRSAPQNRSQVHRRGDVEREGSDGGAQTSTNAFTSELGGAPFTEERPKHANTRVCAPFSDVSKSFG